MGSCITQKVNQFVVKPGLTRRALPERERPCWHPLSLLALGRAQTSCPTLVRPLTEVFWSDYRRASCSLYGLANQRLHFPLPPEMNGGLNWCVRDSRISRAQGGAASHPGIPAFHDPPDPVVRCSPATTVVKSGHMEWRLRCVRRWFDVVPGFAARSPAKYLRPRESTCALPRIAEACSHASAEGDRRVASNPLRGIAESGTLWVIGAGDGLPLAQVTYAQRYSNRSWPSGAYRTVHRSDRCNRVCMEGKHIAWIHLPRTQKSGSPLLRFVHVLGRRLPTISRSGE